MEKKPWRALKFCNRKRKRCKANWGPKKDRLSELHNEILLSILSMAAFTLKEAARTSILSHRWRNLWRYFPILNFEDLTEEKVKWERKFTDLCLERENFIKWVNLIAEDYLCPTVDEFRVAFDLDNSYQCHIDKWVAFALAKRVKRLELDFTPSHNQSFSVCRPELPHNLGSIMSTLTSLRLIYVRVIAEVIECLLNSCPLLENLYVDHSNTLTNIRASRSSLTLKHLEVSRCDSLEAIDISAPKLLSFRYSGPRLELQIKNAFSLSVVLIGSWNRDLSINYALDSLSSYFSQLEFLSLRMSLLEQLNLGIKNVPALTKLKHLELLVMAKGDQSLLGWTCLIEASPMLQKLTVKLNGGDSGMGTPIVTHRGRSLKRLKTLEIDGFLGLSMDLGLAYYVFKNAPKLKEVIVDVTKPFWPTLKPNENALKRLSELERKVPRGVELYLKM